MSGLGQSRLLAGGPWAWQSWSWGGARQGAAQMGASTAQTVAGHWESELTSARRGDIWPGVQWITQASLNPRSNQGVTPPPILHRGPRDLDIPTRVSQTRRKDRANSDPLCFPSWSTCHVLGPNDSAESASPWSEPLGNLSKFLRQRWHQGRDGILLPKTDLLETMQHSEKKGRRKPTQDATKLFSLEMGLGMVFIPFIVVSCMLDNGNI